MAPTPSAAVGEPARAAARVSVVAKIGYVVFLAGPPLIGFLGERTGTLHALAVTGGMVALGLMISGVPGSAAAIERGRAGAAAGVDA